MLKIVNANKTFKNGSGKIKAIDNTNISLDSNGLVAIFGPSGCGKTTLLNVIGGLDDLDSGEITIEGEKVDDVIRNKYIGYIFQNYYLLEDLTVLENVEIVLKLCGLEEVEEIRKRSIEALKSVDMDSYANRYPNNLSGGQMQRVAIARAIVKGAKIILADEPTGNLDETNTIKVMQILKEISKTHLVLLVTHELSLVNDYCDKIIEIVDGKVTDIKQNDINHNNLSSSNKNIIYLENLDKKEIKQDNVNINLYGDQNIDLTIVCVNGNMYISAKQNNLKIVDETSEVKLLSKRKHDEKIDFEYNYTPFEQNNYGNLFKFKDTFISSIKQIIKPKKTKGFVSILLLMLSIMIVFSVASFGNSLKEISRVEEYMLEDSFYIPLDEFTSLMQISDKENNGIKNIFNISHSQINLKTNISINVSNFVSTRNPKVSLKTTFLHKSFSNNDLITFNDKKDSDGIVISKTLADAIIENSKISYLNTYEDLLDNNLNVSIDGVKYFINGISSDRINAIFLNDKEYISLLKKYENVCKTNETLPSKYQLGDDEILISKNDIFDPNSDYVYIHGKKLKVKYVVEKKSYVDSYQNYLLGEYGIPDFMIYNNNNSLNDIMYNVVQYTNMILDDEKIKEFYFDYELTNKYPIEDKYALETTNVLDKLLSLRIYDNYLLAYYYLLTFGNDVHPYEFQKQASDNFYFLIDRYLNSGRTIRDYSPYLGFPIYMNIKTLISTLQSTGITDGVTYKDVREHPFEGLFSTYNYILITSNDYNKTKDYLNSLYGEDKVITNEKYVESLLTDIKGEVIASLVVITIIMIFMCVCVFFIMRSDFTSDVKEIGIYRIVGVSKKNMQFKYFVKSLAYTLLTIIFGYVLSIMLISSLSKQLLFNDIFYFPFYLNLLLFMIITSVSIFFGMAPALLLLRKTPSQIISKYDI